MMLYAVNRFELLTRRLHAKALIDRHRIAGHLPVGN